MSTPGPSCKFYRVMQEAGIKGGRGGDVQLAAFEALQVAGAFRLIHSLPLWWGVNFVWGFFPRYRFFSTRVHESISPGRAVGEFGIWRGLSALRMGGGRGGGGGSLR